MKKTTITTTGGGVFPTGNGDLFLSTGKGTPEEPSCLWYGQLRYGSGDYVPTWAWHIVNLPEEKE